MQSNKIWKGKWRSDHYATSFVNGILEVELPYPLNLNSECEGQAALTYDGVYRHGARSVIKIRAEGGDGHSNQMVPVFKGSIQQQNISFKILSDSPTKISGEYTTTNPGDVGTFEMELTNEMVFNFLEKKPYIDGCVIA